MRHARDDYNRIQDPALHDPTLLSPGSTSIGEDEPVFLIRAKDICAPIAVRAYADLVRMAAKSTVDVDAQRRALILANVADDWAFYMESWQYHHSVKLPDLHPSIEKDESK